MMAPLLKVRAILARDEEADLAALHQRDRSIGKTLTEHEDDPPRQIRAWTERIDAPEATARANQASRTLRASTTVLVLVALLAGAAAATAVLGYEGAGRVNVLAALAVLVGIQAVTLLATAIVMLPPAWRAAIPGLGALQDLLAGLSPGRALRALARRLPQTSRSSIELLGADLTADARLLGRTRKWLALGTAQIFGVAFNLGLLGAYLALVTFTDLAFGWSSTLELEPTDVHRWVERAATPWAGWLPGAAPTLELVETTRYFRAERPRVANGAVLGQWWQFVLMCLVVYALVPRLLLWLLARHRLGAAIDWTLAHLPGTPELLYRLNNEVVETRAEQPEEAARPAAPVAPAEPRASSSAATVIAWNGLELPARWMEDTFPRATGLPGREPVPAGGAATLEEDEQVVKDAVESEAPIAVLVKAWEPPLGDLVDFLADLRGAGGEGRSLVVVPVGTDARHPPEVSDLEVWRRRLSRTGDPWLTVKALAGASPGNAAP